jgi:CHAT domain-containing protein
MLNYVPFNALFDGERYLIEKNLVLLTPSAAVWLSLKRKRKHSPKRGALLMAFSDASIPRADAEVRSIKRYTKSALTFTGRKATFDTFVEHAPKSDLIHLACHGQFRSDAPMFSSLHLADGWITVGDLSRQRLNASLVTLSACETGLGETHAGEEILGLTRGFLSAGARNLIVSLWTVNDEAASRLMADLYQRLQRGDGPAASLRAAQNQFISRGVHPYYWSAFVSIGA